MVFSVPGLTVIFTSLKNPVLKRDWRIQYPDSFMIIHFSVFHDRVL